MRKVLTIMVTAIAAVGAVTLVVWITPVRAYLGLTGAIVLSLSAAILAAAIGTVIGERVSRRMLDRPRIVVDAVTDAPVGKVVPRRPIVLNEDEFQVIELERRGGLGQKIATEEQVFFGGFLPKRKYPGQQVRNPGPGDHKLEVHVLMYRFGVLRLTNTGEYLADARAEGGWRLPGEEVWHHVGNLNWDSEERKHSLSARPKELERIAGRAQAGLNAYLKNDLISVSENETVYLPLFYMNEKRLEVFLSGSHEAQKAGFATPNGPLRFEYRLRVMGKDLRVHEFLYDVSAEWRWFSIQPQGKDGRRGLWQRLTGQAS